jgi:hypothetical protein
MEKIYLMALLPILSFTLLLDYQPCINIIGNKDKEIELMYSINLPVRSSYDSAVLGSDSVQICKSILIHIAQQILSDSNVTLSHNSEKSFKDIINAGVEKLRVDKFTPIKVNEAEENIKKFTLLLIKIQQSKGATMGATIISSGTFNESLSLCPLYPFC